MCVARQKRRQSPTDGIDGATSVAQTSGGGGTSSDMPWRDKDEDYLHWAYRAMRYAHAKHTSVNRSILVHVAILAANLQHYLCIQNCLY